jgi:hypothetical protein
MPVPLREVRTTLVFDGERDDRLHIWLGDEEPHLDSPTSSIIDERLVLGLYGGSTRSGANKNEDAALLMTDADGQWEFSVVVDAHFSSESAYLVIDVIEAEASFIRKILDGSSLATTFREIEQHLVNRFSSLDVRFRAQQVEGEASCLICARKGWFVWWMSIGDCLAYVLHPRLASLGQYTLNQRTFFEWVGLRNTFELPVPCYSSGVRALHEGRSVICLATDGVFEIDDDPAIRDDRIHRTLTTPGSEAVEGLKGQVQELLNHVHEEQGRDSGTVIAWNFDIT